MVGAATIILIPGDEAEGFLLDHALISPARTWPPLPVVDPQPIRLAATRKKMDWEEALRSQPDEPIKVPLRSEEDADKERCVICLMALRDPAIVGACVHEFCVSPPLVCAGHAD
jgi:E3 ubiquitin-protein ligase Topors